MTRNIPKNSDLHKKIAKALETRIALSKKGMQSKTLKWQQAEDDILAYVPESDLDASRRTEREQNGEPKYTTIKIPYSYALLMTAHTYLTSVFFGRAPVHQFSGRHGETEQQVQALEAVIDYQTLVGEMLGPYYVWFYDALKYGVGVIEEYWDIELIQWASIEEQPDPADPLKMQKVMVTQQRSGYKGNKICNVRPTKFFPDPRVPIAEFQKGEFAFVLKTISWETIVRRKRQGYYMNTETLGAKGGEARSGSSDTSQLETPDTLAETNTSTAFENQKHPATVECYEGAVSIIPKEWGLGSSDFPEKWMFTITSDYATIIGCQPHGAAHGRFPYEVLEFEIEGYGLTGRGMPEIAKDLQNTIDWLVNQHFYNVRAALNNQFILDPTKIVAKDAEDGGPGFRYRLRPEAYGQDIRTFFHQVQVQDVTRQHLTDVQSMFGMGERVFGVNDQMFGVLAGGGRKTATEVRTSSAFGVNRLKTVAEYQSATGFSRHSQKMVQNTQQYMDATQKYKIAGTLIDDMGPQAAERFLMVQPEDITGAYDFVSVDGTMPIDRMALANLWKELMMQMSRSPTLMMRYDLGRIFGHIANLAGVRNLQQFRVQLGSPEALMQQAEAGNLVATGGPKGGANPRGTPTSGQGGGVPQLPMM